MAGKFSRKICLLVNHGKAICLLLRQFEGNHNVGPGNGSPANWL
jgi:hypothetical protein